MSTYFNENIKFTECNRRRIPLHKESNPIERPFRKRRQKSAGEKRPTRSTIHSREPRFSSTARPFSYPVYQLVHSIFEGGLGRECWAWYSRVFLVFVHFISFHTLQTLQVFIPKFFFLHLIPILQRDRRCTLSTAPREHT